MNGIYSVVKTTNGMVEFETITRLVEKEDDAIIQDCKPRAAFFKLRAELSKQIAQKRKEEIVKRLNEAKQNDDDGLW